MTNGRELASEKNASAAHESARAANAPEAAVHEPVESVGNPLLDPLLEWLAGLSDRRPAPWTHLPDIGLYMDQVVTYIDRQLALHRSSVKEHVVTSAMVNNYIKDGLLPRADLKKYAPTHLALLTMIGALKPVLSMQDLQILLGRDRAGGAVQDAYGRFLEGQAEAVESTAEQVAGKLRQLDQAPSDQAGAEMLTELRRLALDLAIEARVRILVAEQLLANVCEAEQAALAAQAAKPAEAGEKGSRRK